MSNIERTRTQRTTSAGSLLQRLQSVGLDARFRGAKIAIHPLEEPDRVLVRLDEIGAVDTWLRGYRGGASPAHG